ncbi:MAG: YafY family protein [Candidatus Hydrogenedentales bacterium]
MRRADRLFQIVQFLRRRKTATPARVLAGRLNVSERTIYRDITDLILSGVPVQGEPGVGYLLRGYDLPPLMFTRDEIEALVFGARIVQSWADDELAANARQALEKVEAVLPEAVSHYVEGTPLYAPSDHARTPMAFDLKDLRHAIRDQHKLRIAYVDEQERITRRNIRPLADFMARMPKESPEPAARKARPTAGPASAVPV